MEKLTSVKKDADVKPVYNALLEVVNRDCYDNQLSEEPSLFLNKE